MDQQTEHYKVVVIGSGFGGAMTALPIAHEFSKRKSKDTVLILERGTWWTTPISTVQDKELKTAALIAGKKQPVQFWSSQNHFRGFIDLFTRCFRRTKEVNIFTRLFRRFRNEDGLFDLTRFGTRGFLGLFGGKSDGITVIRASGVGGGSLIYSNITIQPPDFIFDDPRWCDGWNAAVRKKYYDKARNAISYGVVAARNADAEADIDKKKAALLKGVNTGLSNIVTRTARLEAHWKVKPDPNNSRGIKQIQINTSDPVENPPDKQNRLWLDRARVFQTV